MINEDDLTKYINKKIKIIYKNGEEYIGKCEGRLYPVLDDEEPMLFCEPSLAILLRDIKSIEILN